MKLYCLVLTNRDSTVANVNVNGGITTVYNEMTLFTIIQKCTMVIV